VDKKTIQVLALAITRLEGKLGRTKLIKMAYLSDFYARQTLGRPITSFEYKLADHGPFDSDLYGAIAELEDLGISEQFYQEWDGYRYKVSNTQPDLAALLPEEREIVERVIQKFGRLPLQDLLGFVYETAPMIFAKKIGEPGAPLKMDSCNDHLKDRTGLDFETYLASRAALRRGEGVPLDELIDAL
jgi:hypothetical protein